METIPPVCGETAPDRARCARTDRCHSLRAARWDSVLRRYYDRSVLTCAYAEYTPKLNQRATFAIAMRGQDYFGITIQMFQADNGGEFGKWFHDMLKSKGIALRHSRVRKSNNNAHIERFNRTIQEECLSPYVREAAVPYKIYWYLIYYNQFRRHSGIQGSYPLDLLNWRTTEEGRC